MSDWKKELEVGLTGTYICCKIIGGEIAKKGGVILNIASDLSVIAPDQSLYSHLNTIKPAGYSVTKHGLIGLTKYLAVYWAKNKLRVNALSPGGVYNRQDKKFLNKVVDVVAGLIDKALEAGEDESLMQSKMKKKPYVI